MATQDIINESTRKYIENLYNITHNSGSNVSDGGTLVSSGTAVKPTITYNPGGTVTVGEGTYRLYHNAIFSGVITEHTIPETTLDIVDNDITVYIVAKYNNGSPILATTLDISTVNESDIILIYTVVRIGDLYSIVDWDEPALGLPNKLNKRNRETRRFERFNGLNLSESTGRKIIVSSGVVWNGSFRNTLAEVDSSVDSAYLVQTDENGEWTFSAITQWPNDNFDNGNGVTALTAGHYGVVWIYRSMSNIKRIQCFYGNASYATLDAAKTSLRPQNTPNALYTNSMLIGRIIYQKGASTSAVILSEFDVASSASAASTHEGLVGLQGGSAGNHYHAVVGEIKIFAGSTAPDGHLLCNGDAVSRITYADLFNVISTAYGAGDGSTTFNLPNFKGRVPVGFDASQTEFDSLGETGGAKTHTLTIEQMPAHYHTFTDTYSVQNLEATFNNGTACDEIERTENTSTVGGGQAHNNLQPYIVMNYIIKY